MKLLITKRLIFSCHIYTLYVFSFYIAFMIILSKCLYLREADVFLLRGIRKHEGNPRVCETEFVTMSWLN